MVLESGMQLILTVEKTPDPALEGTRWSCDEAGGTLGRGEQCDLVLPDPERFTSSLHAAIEVEGSQFKIVDRSTNGTFHNAPGKLIGKNRSEVLESGDRIYIGEYVLRVEIGAQDAPTQDPSRSEFFGTDSGSDLSQPTPRPAADSAGEDWDVDEFSLPWEGGGSEPEPNTPKSGSDDDAAGFSQSPEREFFAPPSAGEQPGEVIPDDWDDFLTGFHEPGGSKPKAQESSSGEAGRAASAQPGNPALPDSDPAAAANAFEADESRPAVSPEQPAPPDKDSGRESAQDRSRGSAPEPTSQPQSFTPAPQAEPDPSPSRPSEETDVSSSPTAEPSLAPASVREPAPQAPDQPGDSRRAAQTASARPESGGAPVANAELQEMLRVVTKGLMVLLQGRAEIKNEFRIAQTRFVQTENNPLKFSPNAEEAMTRILGQSEGSGFLTGARAFEDALNDLQAHQLALLAAAQRAVESVIGQFDPAQLESRLQRIAPLSARTPGLKAAKCWNLFTMHYDEVAGKMREDARQMFLAEFAEAYEEACQQVMRARENRRQGQA